MRQTKKLLLVLSLLLGVCSAAHAWGCYFTEKTFIQSISDYKPDNSEGVTYTLDIWSYEEVWWDNSKKTLYCITAKVDALPNAKTVTIKPFYYYYNNRNYLVVPTAFARPITNTTMQRLNIETSQFFSLHGDTLIAPNLEAIHAEWLTVAKGTWTNLKKVFINSNAIFEIDAFTNTGLTDLYLTYNVNFKATFSGESPNRKLEKSPFGNRINLISAHLSEFIYSELYWGLMGWTNYDLYLIYSAFKSRDQIKPDEWSQTVDITVSVQGGKFSTYTSKTNLDYLDSYTKDAKSKVYNAVSYSDFTFYVAETYSGYTLKHVYLNGKDIKDEMQKGETTGLRYDLTGIKDDVYIQVVGEKETESVGVTLLDRGGTLSYTDAKGNLQSSNAGAAISYSTQTDDITEVTVSVNEGWELDRHFYNGYVTENFTKTELTETDYKMGMLKVNGDGTYSFPVGRNYPHGHIISFKRKAGDVNGDGEVDVNDIDEVVKLINQQQ